MDLESFFSAVHHIKPLEDPKARPATDVSVRPRSMEEQRHLDITTRPPPMNAEETLHHHREYVILCALKQQHVLAAFSPRLLRSGVPPQPSFGPFLALSHAA